MESTKLEVSSRAGAPRRHRRSSALALMLAVLAGSVLGGCRSAADDVGRAAKPSRDVPNVPAPPTPNGCDIYPENC